MCGGPRHCSNIVGTSIVNKLDELKSLRTMVSTDCSDYIFHPSDTTTWTDCNFLDQDRKNQTKFDEYQISCKTPQIENIYTEIERDNVDVGVKNAQSYTSTCRWCRSALEGREIVFHYWFRVCFCRENENSNCWERRRDVRQLRWICIVSRSGLGNAVYSYTDPIFNTTSGFWTYNPTSILKSGNLLQPLIF